MIRYPMSHFDSFGHFSQAFPVLDHLTALFNIGDGNLVTVRNVFFSNQHTNIAVFPESDSLSRFHLIETGNNIIRYIHHQRINLHESSLLYFSIIMCYKPHIFCFILCQ